MMSGLIRSVAKTCPSSCALSAHTRKSRTGGSIHRTITRAYSTRKRFEVCGGPALQSAKQLAHAVKTGQRSAVEITKEYIERVSAAEPSVQAFLSSDADLALAAAAKVDADVAAGAPLGMLAGVPVAVKDNIMARGSPTTCGSRALEGYSSIYDATAVSKLREAGAVIIGKTNMDEFGMGSTTETSAYQATKNPWDLSRVPGGSSGGSAAAVCAGQAAAALGSDTGGSIRQPASFCGLVGVKPTYGRVSRHGLVAYASSFDCVGPIAHSVEDAALLLQVIAGEDSQDATSANTEVPDYVTRLVPKEQLPETPLKGMKLGVIEETMGEGVDESVKAATEEAVAQYEALGAEVVRVSLPTYKLALPAYYIIAMSEASSNLSRYDGVRYGPRVSAKDLDSMYTATRQAGLGEEVKRRILMGTYSLSAGYYDAYYKKAQQVRTLVLKEISDALSDCSALITPATPTPAYQLQTKVNDPLEMFIGDLCTVGVNLAGLPAVVVPCGRTAESDPEYPNLPLGIQLIGSAFSEADLLYLAHVFEVTSDWKLENSPLV